MTDKADAKILETAKARYKLAREKDAKQRAERLDDLKFSVLLEQWPEALKNARENDPNGGRPCLVVDKINQYVRQVVNDMRQNKPSIKVRGINDSSDEEIAQVLQGATRHIENKSRADIAYDWAGEMAVRTGLGYFRIITEYSSEESFDQDILIKRCIDTDSVTLDADSIEPDGSDAKYGFICEAISKEDFEASYPNAEPIDFDADTDAEWFGEKKVVVGEYFYLESVDKILLALADGSVMFQESYDKLTPDEQMPIVKQRKCKVNKCCWVKMNGKQVLEKEEFPSEYIPIIPVIGNEGFVEGKRYLSGIVRPAKDSQRLYNYVRSAFTEAVSLAPKAPYVAAAGQIEDFPEWEDANTKNYSVLRYKPVSVSGVVVGAPQRQGFASVPTGLEQDMQIAEHDIQSTMGMYNASLGKDGNEKSGRAILAKQKEGDTSTFHFPDNLGRSVQHAGRIIVGMIPRVMDTARVLRIIGEDGSTDFAHINPDQKAAVTEAYDESGAVRKIYNLGVGSYDVAVTVGPSYNTKRMESADAMTQILQGNPDLMQIIGDLYFKSLDMPFSEEIAKRMKIMQPPQLQEPEEGQEPLPPQVQQQMQQMEQALQNADAQMTQVEQQLHDAELEKAKLQHEIDMADNTTKLKAAELQLKGREIAIKEQEATARIRESQMNMLATHADTQAKLTQQQAPQDAEEEMTESERLDKELQAKHAMRRMELVAEMRMKELERNKPMGGGAEDDPFNEQDENFEVKQSANAIEGLNQVMQGVVTLAQEIGSLKQIMSAPKVLVRDEQGRPTGSRIASDSEIGQ